jgi:hypothetical protein
MPTIPPGLYMILIYDGSEGGAHYTWDYFHLLGPAQRPARSRRPAALETSAAAAQDTAPAEWVLGALGAVLLAAGATALVRNRP